MPHRLTVVVSQSRSQNPKKRQLEESIVGELLGKPGIDVTVVPHLYDLTAEGTGTLCLTGLGGDVVVCSWLYPRAARWILDRHGIRGREGVSLLKSLGEEDDDEEELAEDVTEETEAKPRVIDQLDLPPRRIYCLDLRAHEDAAAYLAEIERIARELSTPTVELGSWIQGNPKPEQMERYLRADDAHTTGDQQPSLPQATDEPVARRWYPVIDFSRCTNCVE